MGNCGLMVYSMDTTSGHLPLSMGRKVKKERGGLSLGAAQQRVFATFATLIVVPTLYSVLQQQ